MSVVNNLKPKLIIYTDGACANNPGPGGWGALIEFYPELNKDKIEKHISGYELETTNNRMELTAAIEALKILKKSCIIDIYTDSKYLQQGITQWIHKWMKNNWYRTKNELVKNADLWQQLHSMMLKHDINFHWVKGHSVNIGNIIADQLAVGGKNKAVQLLTKKG
jgi:ribonuclease HI